jgi:hypothetical protein
LPAVELPSRAFQPLDNRPLDAQPPSFEPLELPVAGETAVETITVGEIVELSDSGADSKDRTVARTQATLATAAAIDDIVVAAKLALAEAAFVDTDTASPGGSNAKTPAAFTPAAPAQNNIGSTTRNDPLRNDPARKDLAAFAVTSVVADPSQQVWDSALAAIMALSDEERLALFT